MNFITNLKAAILGIITAVTTAVVPITPAAPVQNLPVNTASPAASGQNYDIRGSYSYFGQGINYHIIVPKNGGSFSGDISGACEAQLGANYAGGNGGAISGSASGKCNILFVKYQGTIPFKGNLYPEEKKLVIELQGAHLPAITLNYD